MDDLFKSYYYEWIMVLCLLTAIAAVTIGILFRLPLTAGVGFTMSAAGIHGAYLMRKEVLNRYNEQNR